MIIEPSKKNVVFIPFRTTDFLYIAIPMIMDAIMGKPILLNKPKGPGIIPIPNIAGSLGISVKPADIKTK